MSRRVGAFELLERVPEVRALPVAVSRRLTYRIRRRVNRPPGAGGRRSVRDPDVRRVLIALVFFAICAMLFASLFVIGLFH
jgi:hypothetical protein